MSKHSEPDEEVGVVCGIYPEGSEPPDGLTIGGGFVSERIYFGPTESQSLAHTTKIHKELMRFFGIDP